MLASLSLTPLSFMVGFGDELSLPRKIIGQKIRSKTAVEYAIFGDGLRLLPLTALKTEQRRLSLRSFPSRSPNLNLWRRIDVVVAAAATSRAVGRW